MNLLHCLYRTVKDRVANIGLRLRYRPLKQSATNLIEAHRHRYARVAKELSVKAMEFCLVERTRLDPLDLDHQTYSLRFRVVQTQRKIVYSPGDMVYLKWQNNPENIKRVLEHYRLDSKKYQYFAPKGSAWLPSATRRCTIAEILRDHVDLHELDKEDFDRLNFDQFLAKMPPATPRPYTLSYLGYQGKSCFFEFTLSESRLKSSPGKRGRAFTSLLELQPGQTTRGWVLPESHRYPEDRGDFSPLIFISTGSGISSVLSLLRSSSLQYPLWIIHGTRSLVTKNLYGKELIDYQQSGKIARLDVALSRPKEGEGPSRYVQDLVSEMGKDIVAWLEQGANLYLCGKLAMAKQVKTSLAKILVTYKSAKDELEALKIIESWEGELRFQASVSEG